MSTTIRVERSYLERRAKARLPGFLEEAITSAAADGEFLAWPEEVFNALKAKYPADDAPGLSEMTANLATASADWVGAGFPLAPLPVLALRKAQCDGCPNHRPDSLQICTLCGCTALKLDWATSRCPIGRWEAVQGVGN